MGAGAMDKDKTKTRRVLELIVVVTIVGCIALVIVELAGNVRAELYGALESLVRRA